VDDVIPLKVRQEKVWMSPEKKKKALQTLTRNLPQLNSTSS
jgi:hypothetical protein